MEDRGLPSVRRAMSAGRWRLLPVLVVVATLAGSVTASAEPLKGTYLGGGVGRRVTFERGQRERSAWAGTLRFRLDTGEELLAFCIQLDVGVRTGNRYKSDGPVVNLPNGCQIANILDKYPATRDLTADEAAARQLAIWRFSDDVDLSKITDAYREIRERATFIADEAAEGACPQRRTEAPDLRIVPEDAEATVGSSLEFLITAGEQDAGRSAHASLLGAATFDDGAQERELTLDDSGSARVTVVSSGVGTATLAVEMPYWLEGGTVFSEIDPTQPSQRLVLAEDFGLTAQARAQMRWLEQPTATPITPTATSTRAPDTATSTRPATATATVATATREATATATVITLTPLATGTQQRTPRARETQATPASTPVVPAQWPKTGAGGGSRGPAALAAWVGLALALSAAVLVTVLRLAFEQLRRRRSVA